MTVLQLGLQASDQIVDGEGRPTLSFQAKWQNRRLPDVYLVADLPTTAPVGAWAYASDCRVFDGAGTQESAAAGTGGLVSYNGANWVIVGTNVTAVA